jgi:hypothetical protein
MAKKAAASNEGKPQFLLPSEHKELSVSDDYKYCDKCDGYVLGSQAKQCTNPQCGHVFPAEDMKEGKATSLTMPCGMVTFDRLELAKQLVTDLGAGDVSVTLKILTAIKKIGSIDDAYLAVEGWQKILDSAGSAEAADATLNALRSMGALAE